MSEFRKVQGLVNEVSLSIVIPKKYAQKLGIAKGDFVRITSAGSQIVLEKADK